MGEVRNPMSEYLSDQGKRTHLLDYLASMGEGLDDFMFILVSLNDGRLNQAEHAAAIHDACTSAMNILGDWVMVEPMLTDIYCINASVANGTNQ